MPVKPRSVTGAGTDRIPLGEEEQEVLRILLTKSRLPKEAAEGFVREVNGAIVAAYDLWPVQSSAKEEFASLERVQEKAEALVDALGVVDDSLSRIVLHNEYLEAFGGRSLDDHLKSVIAYCKERTKEKPKPTRKGRTPQGTLAEDLARLWAKHFGQAPSCYVSLYPASGDSTCSPFIDTLRFILSKIEINKDYSDAALGKIAQRALADFRKQQKFDPTVTDKEHQRP